ncbi:PQQ-dependent catabolism-associated CXXCW motif protein [Pseudomonas sp. TTU2014-080ASC]|uniref:PQQ-dependent catabolism-associated CXXCW motif protein n=1 Tax=Pseudomonas sp. TTU2014-080ASC TaxID=1729724 RepID=UPI00071831F9|nr:sulfurtransferase [Pseudomonas sp. TTU2014-080ASC]
MKLRLPLPTGLSLLACMLAAAPAPAAPELFNADGYRSSHYRSPTPEQATPARTLDTASLQRLLNEQTPALIDVYGRQWLHGQFIEDEVHANIPGSTWLANTGLGELDRRWQQYFEDNLERISLGNKDWPLVFYCRSDCWLGWNAVKRAHQLGYSNLYWYRDGIDAWEQAGLPLTPAHPVAVTPGH